MADRPADPVGATLGDLARADVAGAGTVLPRSGLDVLDLHGRLRRAGRHDRTRRGHVNLCRLAAMMRRFRIHRVAAPLVSALLLIVLVPGAAHGHAQLDTADAGGQVHGDPAGDRGVRHLRRAGEPRRQQARRQARRRRHGRPGWRRPERPQADARDAGDAARVRLLPRRMDDGLARRRRAGSGHLDVHRGRRAVRSAPSVAASLGPQRGGHRGAVGGRIDRDPVGRADARSVGGRRRRRHAAATSSCRSSSR